MSFTSVDAISFRTGAKAFFSGNGLYSVSKSLLQSGQAYYFITIGLSLTTIGILLSSGVPAEMHSLLGPSYLALSSAMACRVFRMVILGVVKDSALSTTFLASAVNKNHSISGPDSTHTHTIGTHTNRRQGPYDPENDIPLKSRPIADPFGVLNICDMSSDAFPPPSKSSGLRPEYLDDAAFERV
ncbi:hypothetical protein HWV62_4277 [Athelia sp. TMB]|nr:hypothetical protein HWV62_4277 [Athelia sp. TMB]